jgi:ubiquinone/menaquinone biosynthesis C-methylase UbiE
MAIVNSNSQLQKEYHYVNKQTKYQKFYKNEVGVYNKTRYETKYGALFRMLHHHCLIEMVSSIDNDVLILEVACGTGHITKLISDMGRSIIACDLTPEMMEQAEKAVKTNNNVSFLRANAFALPFESGKLDLIISTRFLHLFPIDLQQQILNEFYRVLKPGGRLIVDFDNFSQRWFYMVPHLLYNLYKYRRIAPDTHYNRFGQVKEVLDRLGFKLRRRQGVGGWHLLLISIFSPEYARNVGIRQGSGWLFFLSEQFVIMAEK